MAYGDRSATVDRQLDGNDSGWTAGSPGLPHRTNTSVRANELTGTDSRRIGALNLFWEKPRGFTADDVAFAHAVTRHAALALTSSLEVARLNVALDGRKLIGQAQGILMERHNLDETKAFEVLRPYSQDHNIKPKRGRGASGSPPPATLRRRSQFSSPGYRQTRRVPGALLRLARFRPFRAKRPEPPRCVWTAESTD